MKNNLNLNKKHISFYWFVPLLALIITASLIWLNFLFHWSTVSVDWSNTFMNVGANKIKYWRRKIAAFPLIGAKFLNY